MKNRALRAVVFLLLTALLLSLIPLYGTAATTYYDLWIGDYQVSSANKNDVLGDGGKVKFDPQNNVLTLNNPNIPMSTEDSLIYSRLESLKITGTYHMPTSVYCMVGLGATGAVTLAGNFTFRGYDGGMVVNADLTIESGTISAIGTNADNDGTSFGLLTHKLTVGNGVTSFEMQGVTAATQFYELALENCQKITTPLNNTVEHVSGNYYSIFDLSTLETAKRAVISYVEPATYDTYNLWLGGVQVTSLNKNDIFGDGGKAKFDPSTSTLTLNSPTIGLVADGLNGVIESSLPSLTVTGTYHMTSSKGTNYGYFSDGASTTFSGNFTFYGNLAGVGTNGNVTVTGGTLTAYGTNSSGSVGMLCEGKLTVTNGAQSLDLNGSIRGVQFGELELGTYQRIVTPVNSATTQLNGGAYTIFNTGTGSYAPQVVIRYTEPSSVDEYDIWVGGIKITSLNMSDIFGDGKASFDPNGNVLTLNEPTMPGHVTVSGEPTEIVSLGIDLTVRGSYHMTSTEMSYGIRMANGASLTLDGNFEFIGTKYGVYTNAILNVAGGNLKASGGTFGIFGGKNVILAGNITVNSDTYGVYSGEGMLVSGNVTVYGSNVGLNSQGTLTILGTGATFDVTCSESGQAAIAFQNGEIVIPDDYIIAQPADWMIVPPTIQDLSTGGMAKHVVIRPKTFSDYLQGSGTESSPYLIATETDWNNLAKCVNNGDGTEGLYFKQTADISASTMVGKAANYFAGTYNGNNKTLTFNYTGAPTDCAPFRYTQNAKIVNLHTTGRITTANKFSTGLVAEAFGTLTVENCRSSMIIESSVNGDGTHGGFLGVGAVGSTVVMKGCIFDGVIKGENTTHCGGFVGYMKGNITFNDCLLMSGDFRLGSSENFTRHGSVSVTLTNCYYFGSGVSSQGARAYSVTGAEGVTLSFPNPVTTYSLTGITAYAHGVIYDGIFYSGADSEVAFTASCASSSDCEFYCAATPVYKRSNGSRFLIMSDCNAVVEAMSGSPYYGYHSVTGGAGYNNQTGDKLFDNNTATKWCGAKESLPASVVFRTTDPVVVRGYLLATGGDTARYTDRNPVSWTLEGSSDGENWQTIAEVENDGSLPAMNEIYCGFLPTAAQTGGFTYFRYTIITTAGGLTTFQISELQLIVDVVSALHGDVNCDGSITISDVTALLDILSGTDYDSYLGVADIDYSGALSISDVTALLDILATAA